MKSSGLHAEYLKVEGRKIVRNLPNDYVGYQKLPYGTVLIAGEDDMEGAYALGMPDLPAKYGAPLSQSPAEDVGKPGTSWRVLALNEKWKNHGGTVKFKPIAVHALEESPSEESLTPPPSTYLDKKTD
jgi:hypothetical protein